MKTSMISKLFWLLGACAIAAAPGCDEESEPVQGDEQDATSSVDDVFAKTVLKGGCSVTINKTGKTVKTTGKRKAYKMMGMVDYFSGRLFFQGSTERFTAARYCAFLATILAQTTHPIMVVHDGASYHKAAATTAFVAQHADACRFIDCRPTRQTTTRSSICGGTSSGTRPTTAISPPSRPWFRPSRRV